MDYITSWRNNTAMTKNPIKVAKDLSGLTGEQLAEKIGISASYLSRLGSKNRSVKTDLLDKLAEVVGMSSAEFYSRLADNAEPMQGRDLPELKDRLKFARKKAGFASAIEAAQALDLKAPIYTHHENGTRGTSLDMIDLYARFFGVSPEWLQHGGPTPDLEKWSGGHLIKKRALSLLKPAQLPLFGGMNGIEDFIEAPETHLDLIDAPQSLFDKPGAYALRMPGTAMEPRYHEGETLIIIPELPRPGGYA